MERVMDKLSWKGSKTYGSIEAAISALDKKEEIRKFYGEYVEYIALVDRVTEKLARIKSLENIAYVLRKDNPGASEEVINLWRESLPGLENYI